MAGFISRSTSRSGRKWPIQTRSPRKRFTISSATRRSLRAQLNQLLRHGRASLASGFTFVAVCLFAADAIGKFATGNFSTIPRESLTIVGWVAMWRPMQIFLYDWWPLAQRRRLDVSLSQAQVHVVPGK